MFFEVSKEGLGLKADIIVMLSCLCYFILILVNLALQQVLVAYFSAIIPSVILFVYSIKRENQPLFRRLIIFGGIVALLYPLVENIFAPLTRWGYYTTNDPHLGITPLYVPFTFLFFTIALGYISLRASIILKNYAAGALLTGILTFIASLSAEKINAEGGMWIYNQFTYHIWGVPLFIPSTYMITYSTLPYLIRMKLRFAPLIFSLCIGFLWYTLYLLLEGILC